MMNGLNPLAIGMPGGTEVLVVLFIVLLLFGGKKLPELSRAIGRSLSEFKKGRLEGAQSDREADEAEEKEILPPEEKR